VIADARPPAITPGGPRCCYVDSGKPKLRFHSRKAARTYMRDSLGDRFFCAYPCPVCDYWHLATKA